MIERPSASLHIETFRHGADEFDEWSNLLESAVSLATNATSDNHATLCKKWLPLKLDSPSRAIYKQANKEATWADLKIELTKLLIDPQEKYKWQAKRSTLKWDGKESFHALASRIITKVALYDGEMSDASKQKEYFFRFREALPKEYQNAIDMACGAGDRNLETAKDIAQRTKMILDSDEKSVTFAGARLDENRTSSLEMALAKIDNKLETIDSSINAMNAKFKTHDDRISKLENSMEEMRSAWRSQSYQSRSPRSQSPRNASSNSMPRGFSPRGQSYRPQSPCGQFSRPQLPRNQQYDSRGQSSNQGNYYPQAPNQGNYYPQSPNRGNFRPQSSNQGNFRPQSPRSQNYNSGNSNYNTPNSPRRSNNTYVKQPSNNQGGQRDNYRAIDTDDEHDQTDDGDEAQLYAALGTIMKKLKLTGHNKEGEN